MIMLIPERAERLKQTRERLTRILDLAVETGDKKRGAQADRRSAESIKTRDELVDALVEAFDETGFFVAYVGD